MAAPQAKAAASPPPLPPPPPVPVSGITPARKAIAPTLTDEPKGNNPQRELAERQRAAMAKHTGETQAARDAAAGEDAAPPPKASTPTTAQKTPTASAIAASGKDGSSSDSKTPAASSGSGKPASSQTEAGKAAEPGSETSEDATHRYDLKSLRKWAEQHPEDAAEAFTKLGSLPADTREEWIRIKNRERKARENIRGEHVKSAAELQALRDEAKASEVAMNGAAGKLAPIADLWEAVREKIAADPQNPQPDFEAADAAFLENSGISIDDYMRLRARRAIGSSSDAVRLRVENRKLQRQLEAQASAPETKPADSPTSDEKGAGTAEPAGKAKRKERDWSDELPAKHKLRSIEGWNTLIDAEMRRYHDPDADTYDADPEEVANKILKREIERMTEDSPDDDAPAVKTNGHAKSKTPARDGVPSAAELRPKTAPKRAPVVVDDADADDAAPKGFAARQAWALKRHEQRRRGELE